MSSLHHQRCFHHALREAVARCPECGHFFCRECITEHDDRVICAGCLRKLRSGENRVHRGAGAVLARGGQVLMGLLLAWLFFFLAGETLLKLPSSFHDGTLWRVQWTDPE